MPAKRLPSLRTRTLPDAVPKYAVDREALMRFFRPPVSESTFYEPQQQGCIVLAAAVSGRDRLELALVRLGPRPDAELPTSGDEGATRHSTNRPASWP